MAELFKSKKKAATKKKAAAKPKAPAHNPMLEWLADKVGVLKLNAVAHQMAPHNGKTLEECKELLMPLAEETRTGISIVPVRRLKEFFTE